MASIRYVSIDVFRGFSMTTVIVSHLFWGLYSRRMVFDDVFDDPILVILLFFGQVGQMFFFVSGFSTILSFDNDVVTYGDRGKAFIKHARRGILIVVIGLLLDPLVYFHVGHVDTLQLIGLSGIVLSFAYMHIRKRQASDGY